MLILDRYMFNYFFIVFSVAIFFQRIFETFAKRNTIKGAIAKKWTLAAMVIIHLSIFFGAIFEYFFFEKPIYLLVSVVGILLYSFGLALRNYAIRSLKEFWSLHAETRECHKLIRKGPYKYIRHPAYLAIICEIAGMTLIPNTYIAFCIGLLVYIPLISIRIHFEETELIRQLGSTYSVYKKEVNGLLPIKWLKLFRA